VLCHQIYNLWDCIGRGSPDKEHRIDSVKARVQGRRVGEVTPNDLDAWRQVSGLRVACKRAGLGVGGQKLRDELTADRSGGTSDEKSLHE
jgi:hypothetical protein